MKQLLGRAKFSGIRSDARCPTKDLPPRLQVPGREWQTVWHVACASDDVALLRSLDWPDAGLLPVASDEQPPLFDAYYFNAPCAARCLVELAGREQPPLFDAYYF